MSVCLFLHVFIKLKSGGDGNRADISQSSHTRSARSTPQRSAGLRVTHGRYRLHFCTCSLPIGRLPPHMQTGQQQTVFMSVPKDLTPPAAALFKSAIIKQ